MDLKRLRYFVAVAEAGSFTKAASRLYMSQPPLSLHVRNLENELGVQLFRRESRGLLLTSAGATLLEEARSLIRRYEGVWDTVRLAASDQRVGITFGVITSALTGFIPNFIRQLDDSAPYIVPHIIELQSAEQVTSLRHARIDVGIGRILNGPPDIVATPLLTERLYAALPIDHPLASLKAIEIGQLANENFTLYSRQVAPDAFDQILHHCTSAGFSPSITSEAVSGYGSIALVATGKWVTIVPETSTFLHVENVVFRPFNPPLYSVPLSVMAHRSNVTPLFDKITEAAHSTQYP